MQKYIAGFAVRVLRGTAEADPYAHGGSGAGDSELNWDSPTQVGPVQQPVPVAPENVAEAPTPGAPLLLEERLTAYLAYGTDISARDRLEILDGPYAGVYEVDGLPAHYLNPFTAWQAGCAVHLGKRLGG
jgi:hypothetical protein